MTNHDFGRPRVFQLIVGVALLFGVGALVMSVINAVGLEKESDQRQMERIAADVQACERGNTLRQQVVDLAEATEVMVSGILDDVFDNPRSPTRATLQSRIEAFEAIASTIKLTDCASAVPGADEKETE